MKKLALTLALALGATFAMAADNTNKDEGMKNQVKGAKEQAPSASQYWTEHNKAGYMTKEDAMQYKSSDGTAMDYNKLDANGDGRVSQDEWTSFNLGTERKTK